MYRPQGQLKRAPHAPAPLSQTRSVTPFASACVLRADSLSTSAVKSPLGEAKSPWNGSQKTVRME